MNRIVFVFLLSGAIARGGDGGGWVALFDGKSTEGWTAREEVVRFEAVDGELVIDSKKNVWITTEVEMGDFEVEAEVKMPVDAGKGFNSGLAFRCTGAAGKPRGYQCEIDLVKPGGIYGIGLGGWLYPVKGKEAEYAERAEGVLKADDWNAFRVVAVGAKVRTYMNGALIAEVEDRQSMRGYFGIQHHGKGGTVRFRNLRAREIVADTKGAKAEVGRPNILWIVAEDMSPALGCYGDRYATTPNLDAFAKEGVRFARAFAAAPVCSPSRSCLISGMYPGSMGTEQMRSAFPLPEAVKGFPSFLRSRGYFCSNNEKTDYNTGDAERVIVESWDESSGKAHWRSEKREEGQPFFAVFNDMTSHQSRTMVWPYAAFQEHVQSKLDPAEVHVPEEAPVPPYYPNTPTVKRSVARFYDCVTAMDKNVGRILAELEEDGLAEDTIVFFYSDHGSGMPRHKRLLQDSGMRVALMVRFPEKYRHLAPAKEGGVCDDLVSFVDFAPTVLALSGAEVPEYMQGKPFLGTRAEKREYVYGTRDRVDEVFDTTRSVRDGRWLYIRNFMPHLSWMQASVFSDLGEIRNDLWEFSKENPEAMSGPQRHFMGATRPVEELYDCEADPENLVNLAGEDEHRKALGRMRGVFVRMRAELKDTGVIPEGEAWNWVRNEGMPLRDITAGKGSHSPNLKGIWEAADLVGTGTEEELRARLKSHDPAQRFWAVIGLRNSSFGDPEVQRVAFDHLDDISADVRIEVASWLANFKPHREAALAKLVEELENGEWCVALRACRAIELLGEKAVAVKTAMRAVYDRTRDAKGDENFFLAFSSGAFLDGLGEETKPWDFSPGAGSFSADPNEKKE